MQLLLHGERRGIAIHYTDKDGYLQTIVREAEEMAAINPEDPAFVALHREARTRAAELGQKSGLPDEVVQQVLAGVNDPGRFADLVAGYIDITPQERQMLLETLSVEERLRRVLVHVQRQIGVLDAQEDIKSQVQEELGERQREMFLREQLKTIQRELGEDDERDDLRDLKEKLAALELPAEVRKEVDRELEPAGPDRPGVHGVPGHPDLPREHRRASLEHPQRGAPRSGRSAADPRRGPLRAGRREGPGARVPRRAAAAAAAEEADGGTADGNGAARRRRKARRRRRSRRRRVDRHSGRHRHGAARRTCRFPGNDDDRARGPILLFVGPPGVGKTSVAKSIARAMGRKYVRISLGGARDEADIRGHRRTYVGAMPGRIIQGMKQAGTRNPVFLLDEVDKLGVSFQGDPASALLEVLDPAQNDTFVDHYLGVPFDLSEVLFIATANFIQNIPGPLLDRMEVVDFAGYTEREKREIARKYLIPRQFTENGVSPEQLTVTDEALSEVITSYTRESGVRQLEREIGRLARKVARKIAAREVEQVTVDREMVDDLLGRPKVHPEKAARQDEIGVATGMYYTPTGGDIMFVEASTMRGKGELVLTGQLGDVMKESARAAWTYARSHAAGLQIADEMFDRDIHIHVPAGAIPKDGPSAGVTMASAVVSTLSGRPVRHDIAMTGEITLRGRVLPIGGVKEKVLGAVRAGINRIILPKENEPDLEDLPAGGARQGRDLPGAGAGRGPGPHAARGQLPRGQAALRRRKEPAGRDAALGRVHALTAKSVNT